MLSMFINHHRGTLKSKVTVITGAAQGIGFAIAQSFVRTGNRVVIVDRDRKQGLESAKKLGKDAHFIYCDLACEESVERLANQLLSQFLSIDTIIHNARNRDSAESLTEHILNEWDETFSIMLKHPILLTQCLLPALRKSENPSVIFIGSTNGTFISSQSLSYHLVKSALLQATRFLACEYGGEGIRINLLEVGIVSIPGRTKKEPERFDRALRELIPLRRAATVEEVSDCCLFLASEKASFVSGSKLSLDGGEHLKDHFELVYSKSNLAGVHD